MTHFNLGAVMWMPNDKFSPWHMVTRKTKSKLAHTWKEGSTKYSAMGMKKHNRYVHLVTLVLGHASLQPWGSDVDAQLPNAHRGT